MTAHKLDDTTRDRRRQLTAQNPQDTGRRTSPRPHDGAKANWRHKGQTTARKPKVPGVWLLCIGGLGVAGVAGLFAGA